MCGNNMQNKGDVSPLPPFLVLLPFFVSGKMAVF